MLGADMLILKECEEKTRFSFSVAGAVVTAFLIVTFTSVLYLMRYVTNNWLIDFTISFLLTFTVINLYRFSVSNLGWMADAYSWKKDISCRILDPPDNKSASAKLFFLSLLFMFVSKPLELMIFHPLIEDYISNYQIEERNKITTEIEKLYNGQIVGITGSLHKMEVNLQQKKLEQQDLQRQKSRASNYATVTKLNTLISRLNVEIVLEEKKIKAKAPLLQQQLENLTNTKNKELQTRLGNMLSGETLIVNLKLMNKHLPATWLFTIIFIAFFLTPIIWRTFYRKYGNEEYEIKRIELEMSLIDQAYASFKSQYEDFFKSKFDMQVHFQELYYDAPYNCHIITDTRSYKSKDSLITYLMEHIYFPNSNSDDSRSIGEKMIDLPPPDDAN